LRILGVALSALHRIGILTALPEVELPAVLRAFGISSEASPVERYQGERYWVADVEASVGLHLNVIISCFGLSGNTESPLPVERLIGKYRPELMILCGIACGIRKFALGDVVTSDIIWAYEYVKTTGDGPLDRSRSRIVPAHIRDDIQFFNSTKAWQDCFHDLQGQLKPAQQPRKQFTPSLQRLIWIASGEKVMANNELTALNAKHNLIRAGEMEGYGFANACDDRRPSVPWLVVRGISDYGDLTKDNVDPGAPLVDEYHFTAANAAAAFVRTFLTETYTLAEPPRTPAVLRSPSDFVRAFVAELANLVKRKQYETIVRYRETFSRFLWVEGRLKERVRMGRIAEDAAAKLGKTDVQIAALLDDVGWSLAALRKFKDSKQSLLHGLRLAQDAGNRYWAAKAHRHLAGLYLEEGKHKLAFKELATAERLAKKIPDRRERIEMLAGIAYGRAVIAHLNGQLKDALRYLNRSEKLQEILHDASRAVRFYALKGKIAEAKGDLGLAKDLYRRGLEQANKIGRKDEMIRNELGLARVFAADGDAARSLKHRTEAQTMLKVTPVPYEPGEREISIFVRRYKNGR
jgi:nucleoside phosphorylase/tetratricopeptide (TPR) repeat protein